MHKKFPDDLSECCSSQYLTNNLDDAIQEKNINEPHINSVEFFLDKGLEFTKFYSVLFTKTEKFLFRLGYLPYRKQEYENCKEALEILKSEYK